VAYEKRNEIVLPSKFENQVGEFCLINIKYYL